MQALPVSNVGSKNLLETAEAAGSRTIVELKRISLPAKAGSLAGAQPGAGTAPLAEGAPAGRRTKPKATLRDRPRFAIAAP